MALARYQRTVTDDAGDIISGATVTVRYQATNTIADIYSDRDGTTPMSNPTTTDSNGFFYFFASGDAYKIEVSSTSPSYTQTLEYVGIGTLQEYDLADVQTIVDTITGLIETPAAGDYVVMLKSPMTATITETTTKAAAGTATATFKINTVALGGGANSVSTSENSVSHSSSNTILQGDDIVLTLSGVSGCSFLSFSVAMTRTILSA